MAVSFDQNRSSQGPMDSSAGAYSTMKKGRAAGTNIAGGDASFDGALAACRTFWTNSLLRHS